MNQLADVLSCMYSDEPQGIVHAASEYVTAEEKHTPSALILKYGFSATIHGESIFLGAARAQWKAHQAFLNACKVVYKVWNPSEQLEGKSVPKLVKTSKIHPKTLKFHQKAEFEPEILKMMPKKSIMA